MSTLCKVLVVAGGILFLFGLGLLLAGRDMRQFGGECKHEDESDLDDSGSSVRGGA